MNELQTRPREHVLQPNVISRAVYDLSPNARRLVAMAMSLIPADANKPEDYFVRFTIKDFEKALGVSRGARTRSLIIAAVRECLDSHIEIFYPDDRWVGWTWFTMSALEYEIKYPEWDEPDKTRTDFMPVSSDEMQIYSRAEWETIVMEFNPRLGKLLSEFKKAYAKIRLEVLGELQSKYAIRYYELALSWAGFAGKEGNAPGRWYFDYSLLELRTLFGLAKSKYRATNDFRKYVIDYPIDEINAADIGLRIKPEYSRKQGRGRKLVGARFHCEWITADNPASAASATASERKIEELRGNEEFERYVREYEAEHLRLGSGRLVHAAAEQAAMGRWSAAHAPRRGRGRPRKNVTPA